MRIKTKNNGRSEGSIREQFAYLPNSDVYPNSSGMNVRRHVNSYNFKIEMDKREELKIELLIKECDSVGQEIKTLFLASEKVIGLGLAIIAAGLTFGLKEKINEILLFLPIAVLGVMLYGVHIFTELMSLGGYKCYLEERINTILGENILLWESFIAKERHRAFITYFLHFVYLLFLASTIYISLNTACRHYESRVFWGIVIVILTLSIGLIVSFVKMYRAFNKTYQMAKRQANQKIAINTPPNMAQED